MSADVARTHYVVHPGGLEYTDDVEHMRLGDYTGYRQSLGEFLNSVPDRDEIYLVHEQGRKQESMEFLGLDRVQEILDGAIPTATGNGVVLEPHLDEAVSKVEESELIVLHGEVNGACPQYFLTYTMAELGVFPVNKDMFDDGVLFPEDPVFNTRE